MPAVVFHAVDVKFRLTQQNCIRKFIKDLFLREGKPLNRVAFLFCSDEYLLNLNETFLQHYYYTDILTFDLSTEIKKGVVGEVYISIDRIKDNAIQNAVLFENEFLRILIHGSLHLCDYLDNIESAKNEMTAKEDFYIDKFEAFHVKQNQSFVIKNLKNV